MVGEKNIIGLELELAAERSELCTRVTRQHIPDRINDAASSMEHTSNLKPLVCLVIN